MRAVAGAAAWPDWLAALAAADLGLMVLGEQGTHLLLLQVREMLEVLVEPHRTMAVAGVAGPVLLEEQEAWFPSILLELAVLERQTA